MLIRAERSNGRISWWSRLLARGILAGVAHRIEAQECPHSTLPAYAHNDYANPRPLVDALTLGFRGVEADVFLVDGVFRVGHDKRAARTGGTLDSLYLAPLQAHIARRGALTADARPFLLTIEIKEARHRRMTPCVHCLPSIATLERRGANSALSIVPVGWSPPASPAEGSIDALIGVQRRLVRTDTGRLERTRHVCISSVSTTANHRTLVGTSGGRRQWWNALRAARLPRPIVSFVCTTSRSIRRSTSGCTMPVWI